MKQNYLDKFTIVHVNYPNKEQVDKMIDDIQRYFDVKYGKVQKKEKPVQNFSLNNCTTKNDLVQDLDMRWEFGREK